MLIRAGWKWKCSVYRRELRKDFCWVLPTLLYLGVQLRSKFLTHRLNKLDLEHFWWIFFFFLVHLQAVGTEMGLMPTKNGNESYFVGTLPFSSIQSILKVQSVGSRCLLSSLVILLTNLVCLSCCSGTVVKARDKYRHPGCFVCSDCDVNLKQKGYFFVEGQLYCEAHARARMRPPEGHDLITTFPSA